MYLCVGMCTRMLVPTEAKTLDSTRAGVVGGCEPLLWVLGIKVQHYKSSKYP